MLRHTFAALRPNKMPGGSLDIGERSPELKGVERNFDQVRFLFSHLSGV